MSESRVIVPVLLQAKTFTQYATGDFTAWFVMSMRECLWLIIGIDMFMMMMAMVMVMIVFTGDQRELNDEKQSDC